MKTLLRILPILAILLGISITSHSPASAMNIPYFDSYVADTSINDMRNPMTLPTNTEVQVTGKILNFYTFEPVAGVVVALQKKVNGAWTTVNTGQVTNETGDLNFTWTTPANAEATAYRLHRPGNHNFKGNNGVEITVATAHDIPLPKSRFWE